MRSLLWGSIALSSLLACSSPPIAGFLEQDVADASTNDASPGSASNGGGSNGSAPSGGGPGSGADATDSGSNVSASSEAGTPAVVDAGDPLGTNVTCTSNVHWTGGNDGSSKMTPGSPCVSCHAASGGEAPLFVLAGTVYPTAHEPNDCNGTATATVVVVDSNGTQFSFATNATGNFYSSSSSAPVPPYTAKVVANGNERAMVTAQTSGDCNSCHTEMGANGAPGRVMAP